MLTIKQPLAAIMMPVTVGLVVVTKCSKKMTKSEDIELKVDTSAVDIIAMVTHLPTP